MAVENIYRHFRTKFDIVHEDPTISNEFLEDLELIDELRPFIEPKDLPE